MIISRGLSFGASGSIDLSGDDGARAGTTYTFDGTSRGGLVWTFHGASGGGGAPGGFALLLDGNHTPPELATELISLHGDTPVVATPHISAIVGAHGGSVPNDGETNLQSGMSGIAGYDMGDAAYTLQYIPEYNTAGQENDPPPPDVTGFTVSQNGGVVFFKWNPVRDDNLDGYEIRYSADTVNSWDDALPLTVAAKGTRITDGAISSGDYRFYIRAYDLNDQYSQNAATQTLTVVSDFDIIVDSEQSPDWLRQNWLNYSNTFNSWSVDNTPVITDNGDGTWTIEDNNAAAWEPIYQTISGFDVDQTYSAAMDVKQDAVTSRFVMLRLAFGGSTNESYDVSLNTSTGAILHGNNATAADVMVLDTGEYWRIGVKAKSADPLNTTMQCQFYSAVGASALGVYENTATGSATIRNACVVESDIIVADHIEVTGTARATTGGVSRNFIRHWTGVLIPQSQDGDSLADDIMDVAVPRPFDTCIYESSSLDVGFDDTIRAWSEVTAAMLPSETGTLTVNKYVDYRTSAGSYDGFEAWESGDVYGRYVKFKLEMDTTTGVGYVSGHRCVADLIERSESATAVAIGASGTTINFTNAFHVAPYVEATNADGTAKIVSISNITTTGFDVDVYNTSGTGVTGTINWSARGV